MGLLLLIALAGAWIVFLVPVVKARAWHRPLHTVQHFETVLRTLGHFGDQAPVWRSATGRWILVPTTDAERRRRQRQSATRRRQGAAQVFVLLAGTALFLAVLGGGLWWLVQGFFDLLLGVYIVLLGRRAMVLRTHRELPVASVVIDGSGLRSPKSPRFVRPNSSRATPLVTAFAPTRVGDAPAAALGQPANRVAVTAPASGQARAQARPSVRPVARPGPRSATRPTVRPTGHRPDLAARPRLPAPVAGGR